MAEPVRLVASNEEPSAQALPHNLEAEAALLGALMIDNRLAEDVQLKLRPEHFFDPLHGRVYETILRLIDRNMIASPVTLRPMFEGDEAMAAVGGPAYLAGLTGSGASLIGARDFARQVYDLALLRALVGVGRTMVEDALDTSQEVEPLGQIERAEAQLYRVAEEGGGEGGISSFASAASQAIRMAEKAMSTGGSLAGLTTGIASLDAKLGGLRGSDLIICAGRPGMGKSALGTNIAFALAQRYLQDKENGIDPAKMSGAPAAIFSLEMSADQIAGRVLAEQSRINSEALRMGKISAAEFRQLARAASQLESMPIYIDDTPALSIAGLRTRARRLKRQKGIGFVFVDYLQLLQGTGRGAGDNRVQEISEISRGLKTLAKELDVPVLAASQLSRQVESREDKRPQLSDLRESGSIEQDADIVMFIYREEYYLANKAPDEHDAGFAEWQERMEKAYGRAELIVAKQRHGATGKVEVKFEGKYTRFSDPD